jgi:flagellar biosynthesis protein
MKRRKTPSYTRTVSGQSDIAVALRYDGENAPRVTAKGNQAIAEEMMRIAAAHDVPLYPNPELATALVQIPLGEEVPEELYRAVAEVISFAYLVARKMPKGFSET